MAYQLNPGQDLLPFMNSSWDELTKTLNIAEKQKDKLDGMKIIQLLGSILSQKRMQT